MLNSSESRRQSVLSVLTADRLRRRRPIKLWFAEEAEMEDWLDRIQIGMVWPVRNQNRADYDVMLTLRTH